MASVEPVILITDDEPDLCELLSHLMGKEGYQVKTASDGQEALRSVSAFKPDVMLLDIRLPDLDGMEVLQRCKQLAPNMPIVLMTAYAEVRGAIEAMKAGAHDYLTKPLEHSDVLRVVGRAVAEGRLKRKFENMSRQVSEDLSLAKTMGPSDVVSRLIDKVNRVAESDFTVIINGETGSGKELVARAIHHLSPRSGGAFVAVDCGSLHDSLLESELFGHEKGAFTGAHAKKPGKFEQAKNGTLLLDEISNMTLGAQAKLLRAIQEKVICRVGGTDSFDVDVRLLVSCNQDLGVNSNAGSFRSDLYYRLDEFTINVPPLRERRDDIPYLSRRFMEITNMELGKSVQDITGAALDTLVSYDWPGNVRQLRSTLRRAVLLADDVITERQIELPQTNCSTDEYRRTTIRTERPWENFSLKEIVQRNTEALEKDIIRQALEYTHWNKAEAARLLQVDYKTLHVKFKRLGLAERT